MTTITLKCPDAIATHKGWTIHKKHEVAGRGAQAPGFITLCEDTHNPMPFFVHFFNAQDGVFYHGRYYGNRMDAMATFDEKVALYTAR